MSEVEDGLHVMVRATKFGLILERCERPREWTTKIVRRAPRLNWLGVG